jgi:hypothetical protein
MKPLIIALVSVNTAYWPMVSVYSTNVICYAEKMAFMMEFGVHWCGKII